jgi:hypothetical protein
MFFMVVEPNLKMRVAASIIITKPWIVRQASGNKKYKAPWLIAIPPATIELNPVTTEGVHAIGTS